MQPFVVLAGLLWFGASVVHVFVPYAAARVRRRPGLGGESGPAGPDEAGPETAGSEPRTGPGDGAEGETGGGAVEPTDDGRRRRRLLAGVNALVGLAVAWYGTVA